MLSGPRSVDNSALWITRPCGRRQVRPHGAYAELVIEFVLFGVPAVIYVLVQARGRDGSTTAALNRIGARWGAPSAYG